MRRLLIPVLVILIGAITLWQQQGGDPAPGRTAATEQTRPADPQVARNDPGLPPEALATIRLIRQGGPFPHRQDGRTFGNREGLLPDEARDWYREYTVPTPGASDRGARRIVTGGTPPSAWYYTDDHYRSFRPFDPDEESPP
jgi:guanyl-specific ribonuclease Sa